MAAKEVASARRARAHAEGRRYPCRRGEGHARPEGPQRRARQGFGAPRITKDGVTVAKEIELPTSSRTWARRWCAKWPRKTNDIAGDGTTTATVLAQAIVREGIKAVAAGMNPMDLKRGIDLAVDAVVATSEALEEDQGSDGIAQVGTISANGDSESAK